MNTKLIMSGLMILSSAREVLKECGLLPNIEFPTMGGIIFWEDIYEHEGWRVQRNSITGHFRILDPEDVRHAWAFDEDALVGFFEKIVYQYNR